MLIAIPYARLEYSVIFACHLQLRYLIYVCQCQWISVRSEVLCTVSYWLLQCRLRWFADLFLWNICKVIQSTDVVFKNWYWLYKFTSPLYWVILSLVVHFEDDMPWTLTFLADNALFIVSILEKRKITSSKQYNKNLFKKTSLFTLNYLILIFWQYVNLVVPKTWH